MVDTDSSNSTTLYRAIYSIQVAYSFMKHSIGIIALVVAAIVFRFLPLPSYDICIHDDYFIVRLNIVGC
jgi:hypothetical protein